VWDVAQSVLGSITDTESTSFSAELTEHENSVFAVSWAHPKFGTVLASGGYDGKFILWKELKLREWVVAYRDVHEQSVNCVEFGPWEFGLTVCVGA